MNSAIKFAGGKGPIASKIVALLPPHQNYVEPYAGGMSVLFAKDPEGVSEVVNDLNSELITFWRVLQDEKQFKKFQRIIEAVPFSEQEFREADPQCFDPDRPIQSAVNFFTRCRQSMAGRMKNFAPITKNRLRRGMNEQVSAWLTAIEGLPEVHARLKRVLILNRPAIEVIKQFDNKKTLLYSDCPYHHGTRTTTTEYGNFEMSDEDHRELIDTLLSVKSKAAVSMYHHKIYDALHKKRGWTLHEFNCANHASSKKNKDRKIECLWVRS